VEPGPPVQPNQDVVPSKKDQLGGPLPTEQEIRDLCFRLTTIEEPEEFRAAVGELRVALREHIKDAENRGIHMILNKPKVKTEKAGSKG
jgi:hypothetical protein